MYKTFYTYQHDEKILVLILQDSAVHDVSPSSPTYLTLHLHLCKSFRGHVHNLQDMHDARTKGCTQSGPCRGCLQHLL